MVTLGLVFHFHGSVMGEGAVAKYFADSSPRGLGMVALALTQPSHFVVFVLVMAVLAGWGRWRDGVLLFVVLVAVAFGNDAVLKPLVGRVKGSGLAFPSGHMVAACLSSVALCLVLAWRWPERAFWKIGLGVGASYALVVAWWLLSKRYHYPADVVGSVCVGVLSAGFVVWVRSRLGRGVVAKS